jgi:translation initiation factor RLI1
MPGKLAIVLYEKCRPGSCPSGVCLAAKSCPRKVLRQEAPYETPIPSPSPCAACSDCVRACPNGAIQLVVM